MSSEIILENFETKSNRVCLDEGSPRNVGDEQSNFIVSNIRDELTGNVHQLRRIVANRGISTLIKMISPSLVRLTLKLNAASFDSRPISKQMDEKKGDDEFFEFCRESGVTGARRNFLILN